MRHLLDWHSIDDATWEQQIAAARNHYRRGRTWTEAAHGRSLALLFFNPSLRTRTSMELAGTQLGAHVTPLTAGQGTWDFAWGDKVVMDGSRSEHIREAAGVLSRYYDAIGMRAFASLNDYERDSRDTMIHTFTNAASVPVINLESAFYHPCQALGDAATLQSHFDGEATERKFVLAWTYHPKALPMAVANSALLMASRLGMDVTIARPEEYPLDAGIMEQARGYAEQKGGALQETHDMDAAFDGADVIYAKAWAGPLVYEDPRREVKLREARRDWRVTTERMARTNEAAFMHCLPVRRNVVVDDAVLDSSDAIHLLQAEFRLHAQKAILERVWELEEGKGGEGGRENGGARERGSKGETS